MKTGVSEPRSPGPMSAMGIFQQLRPVRWLLYEPFIVLQYAGNFHFYGLLQTVGSMSATLWQPSYFVKQSVLRESDGMGAVKLHAEYDEYDHQDPSS
jgi:hypothetical protein